MCSASISYPLGTESLHRGVYDAPRNQYTWLSQALLVELEALHLPLSEVLAAFSPIALVIVDTLLFTISPPTTQC